MNDAENIELISNHIPVSIDLGEIELGLADLLSLRPGMIIAFKKPEIFEGVLRIGSNAWADAQVQVEAEEVVLTIKELIPLRQQLARISE